MPFAFRAGRVPGTRKYVCHPNYVVVYSVGTLSIHVLRILHTHREYP